MNLHTSNVCRERLQNMHHVGKKPVCFINLLCYMTLWNSLPVPVCFIVHFEQNRLAQVLGLTVENCSSHILLYERGCTVK